MNFVSLPGPSTADGTSGAFVSPDFALAYRLEAAVWIYDIDQARVIRANAAACKLWAAASEAELAGRDMSRDMSPTVAKRLQQYQSDFLKDDTTFTELWTLYPNGSPQSVMVVYRGFRLDDGRMAMMCEVVSQREDEPQNLRSAEALLHTDVLIMLFDQTGPALYLNPAARNTIGGADRQISDLFLHQRELNDLLASLAAEGEQRHLTRLRTVDGDSWFDLTIKRCSDAATGLPAVLITAIDVSELKEARDTARYLADRDQLTNLHNRSYLQDVLASFENSGQAQGMTVIVFDVDRFKHINDRFGHPAGDTVLRQIAIRTRAVLKPQDLVARLGGDEFVIVLKDDLTADEVASRIALIRKAIRRPILHGETRLVATISVGVSRVTATSPSFSKVMREADIALYRSKSGGRDSVTVFDEEMGQAVTAREQLEIALKQAIAQQEFELHYQPRLDLTTGRIVGAEGLVRWNKPDAGLVMPNDFIKVCEETGLIDELGQIVLQLGCAQAVAWHRAGLDLSVSVNVSPRQFSDPDFVKSLAENAAHADFPRDKIELEITENVLIGNPVEIAEKLRTISAMGYHIAIDDFGTGYSNLSYITEFPLTCLKIDRRFVDQLPASGPIVQLILTLAQQIGATVVSEGVETREQLAWLIDHNCTQAQGFLITKALPPDAFEAFLTEFSFTSLA